MKLLDSLRETPIGRALIAYFADLPRWALLNVIFAVALVPSLVAGLRGEFGLALVLSFPAALVLAGLVRLLSVTVEGRIPHWSLLWADLSGYAIVLSLWAACVLAGLVLLTPLFYLAVIPALVLLLIAPMAVCSSARLHVSVLQAWRNGFILAVHYPIVALGLIVLGLLTVWGISISGGALIIALPALWAAIAVFTVDDLIRSLREQEYTP